MEPRYDDPAARTLDDLIAEARRLIDSNRALEGRLNARRLWRVSGLALTGALVFYAWSIHGLLAESAILLRANTELVQNGNALLRANSNRQQELQSALRQMRPPVVGEPTRPDPPRPRLDGCSPGLPGCDSSTRWVPGFPGPRVSVKRASLRSS